MATPSAQKPLRILVVGGSQGTGALAVKRALDSGHTVTAFARSPDKLGFDHPNLRKHPGDFHRADSVRGAMTGQDAVIVTASVNSLKAFRDNPTFFSSGTRNVLDAMKVTGTKRIVILSAIGAGESKKLLPWLLRKLVAERLLRVPMDDHAVQEQLVEQSGLEFVIVRPPRLTNGRARGKYVKTAALEKVPGSMSRADVADFLVESCEDSTWVGKAVQVGG
jgi:uncharacterized protein YbjT (DUF2867 family)